MKKTLLTLALISVFQFVSAQEHLPRTEALQYAFLASTDLTQLLSTPIPTDVDVKHAVAMRDGEYGAMVLPEVKLQPETLAQAGKNWISIGQLWLHNLTPMRDGWSGFPAEQLRLVTVNHADGVATVAQCALGVRSAGADKLELAVFGKTQKPILSIPLKAISASQEIPIAMAAERTYDDTGRITLRILGKYEANLSVTGF